MIEKTIQKDNIEKPLVVVILGNTSKINLQNTTKIITSPNILQRSECT
jgi:hypothetical protein